jgi:hypothetical protein
MASSLPGVGYGEDCPGGFDVRVVLETVENGRIELQRPTLGSSGASFF